MTESRESFRAALTPHARRLCPEGQDVDGESRLSNDRSMREDRCAPGLVLSTPPPGRLALYSDYRGKELTRMIFAQPTDTRIQAL